MGIAGSRETVELLNTALRVVAARNGLQMIADELIEALSQSLRFLTSAGYELIVDGKRDIHKHIICAHILCVNTIRIRFCTAIAVRGVDSRCFLYEVHEVRFRQA